MEPAQVTQPKRRRRWLIVAFVLVLVSMVSWWYWPRGDARFVGRWAVSANGFDRETKTLNRFGIGYGPATTRFPWTVRGNQLVLGLKARHDLWWEFVGIWEPLTGEALYTRISETYEILSISSNQIRLRSNEERIAATNEPVIVILTRIPE